MIYKFLIISLLLLLLSVNIYLEAKKNHVLKIFKKKNIIFSGLGLQRHYSQSIFRYFFDFILISRTILINLVILTSAGLLILMVDPFMAEPIFFTKSNLLAEFLENLSYGEYIAGLIAILFLSFAVMNIFHMWNQIVPQFFSRFYIKIQNNKLKLRKRYPYTKLVEIDFSKEYKYEKVVHWISRVGSLSFRHPEEVHIFSQNNLAIAIIEQIESIPSFTRKAFKGLIPDIKESLAVNQCEDVFEVYVLQEIDQIKDLIKMNSK